MFVVRDGEGRFEECPMNQRLFYRLATCGLTLAIVSGSGNLWFFGRIDAAAASLTSDRNPPIAVDDSYTTNEDYSLEIPAPGVLTNDSIVEGDVLSAFLVVPPEHGVLGLNLDGSFSYIPEANYNGLDGFLYEANDGFFDSNLASVQLTVTPINDAPLSQPDSYETGLADALSIVAPGVLANDSDIELTPLTVMLESAPMHAASFDLYASGAFTFLPQQDYIGLDSFTYRAFDGELSSEPITVEITVFDDLSPQLSWISPVENGAVFDVEEGMTLTLEVEASDNIGVRRVRFFYWDAINLRLSDIGTADHAPYQMQLDSRLLNPEWNQVFAQAYDARGNQSLALWIWLYKIDTQPHKIFLPLTIR
jgi:hypothetical protein